MSARPATELDGRLRARVAAVHAAYADAVARLRDSLPAGWSSSTEPVGTWSWAWLRRDHVEPPEQGWKLHVSAAPASAARLVSEVLPELGALEVWFKLPSELSGVLALTSGAAGPTQVGKIVTVYPADDEAFRAAATLLDRAWRPVDAVRPPFDPALGTGGGLSARYGAIRRGEVVVDAVGRPRSALRAADGSVVADDRGSTPAWAPPPPVTTRPPEPATTGRVFEVGGRRFAALRRLTQRHGAAVHAALDTGTLDLVFVRTATPGAGADELGHDAVARLTNEHRVLRRLDGRWTAPTVLGHDAERHLLVTRDLGGRSLEHLDVPEGLTALALAARAVAGLHSEGLVHRDLKPANIVYDGARAGLLDFELAAPEGGDDQIVGGTAGYLPPGGEYADASPAQDVFALGGCLTYVLLGSCPGRLPREDSVGRRLELLRMTGQHAAAALVARLCATDPDDRPEAAEAAELIEARSSVLLAEWSAPAPRQERDQGWAIEAARAAAAATQGFRVPHRVGHHWRNAHHFAAFACQGLNLGAAGIVVGLATVDHASGTDERAADVVGGAEWLADLPAYPHAHGLFTGNAGVAVALGLAGRRASRPDLVDAARRRLGAASAGEAVDHDLFSGAAGIVLAGVSLGALLDEPWPLELVADAAHRLVAAARPVGEVVGWPAGPDFDASGTTYFGAAHGAAGIALALEEWGRASGDAAASALAVETLVRLHDEARTEDGAGFLADTTGRVFAPAAWCHGVTGLSWCLEQVAAGNPALAGARRWAADRVRSAGVALGDPTLCHGTAGSLETYRLLGDADRAAEAAAVLRVTRQAGRYGEGWASEDPTMLTPDLWVGFLGPATQLALHARGVRDPVLSTAWLRECAGA